MEGPDASLLEAKMLEQRVEISELEIRNSLAHVQRAPPATFVGHLVDDASFLECWHEHLVSVLLRVVRDDWPVLVLVEEAYEGLAITFGDSPGPSLMEAEPRVEMATSYIHQPIPILA